MCVCVCVCVQFLKFILLNDAPCFDAHGLSVHALVTKVGTLHISCLHAVHHIDDSNRPPLYVSYHLVHFGVNRYRPWRRSPTIKHC